MSKPLFPSAFATTPPREFLGPWRVSEISFLSPENDARCDKFFSIINACLAEAAYHLQHLEHGLKNPQHRAQAAGVIAYSIREVLTHSLMDDYDILNVINKPPTYLPPPEDPPPLVDLSIRIKSEESAGRGAAPCSPLPRRGDTSLLHPGSSTPPSPRASTVSNMIPRVYHSRQATPGSVMQVPSLEGITMLTINDLNVGEHVQVKESGVCAGE